MTEKKERSEAQKRAFARCLAAREASILTKAQEAGTGEREEEKKTIQEVPPKPLAAETQSAGESETEEIDVTALFNEIDRLREEQGSLREQLSGLDSRWQHHETLARDQIRFV